MYWASQVAQNPSAGDTRDTSSIPRSGRSSGEGNGYPLQYSCPRNLMDRGAWQAIWSLGPQRVEHYVVSKQQAMQTISHTKYVYTRITL